MINILKNFLLLMLVAMNIQAQQFKSHIGLNDRLMNSFLLCDRAVNESIIAKYEEVDIARYNEEYVKFSICSKKADEVALNLVLTSKLNCSKATHIMFKHELVCQISLDAYYANNDNEYMQRKAGQEVQACLKLITKICDDYLTEKNIPKAN
jgi:hypothetical protein